MHTTLMYHNREMAWTPTNISSVSLASRLAERELVQVILEPGDGTRYDLLIGRVYGDGRLLVARTTGTHGDLRSAVLMDEDPQSFEGTSAIAELADGNDWSGEFFAWWFARLWSALGVGI